MEEKVTDPILIKNPETDENKPTNQLNNERQVDEILLKSTPCSSEQIRSINRRSLNRNIVYRRSKDETSPQRLEPVQERSPNNRMRDRKGHQSSPNRVGIKTAKANNDFKVTVAVTPTIFSQVLKEQPTRKPENPLQNEKV